ncbi:MAG TPA: hypothetical protein VFL76_04790 [Edaphocola sp.]|nr:hypothetical protein [Edaphocola sp.]
MPMDTDKPSGPSHDDVSLKDVLLSVREWLHYLLLQWKILAIALLVGGLAGIAYSYFSPRKYVAKTTFVLDDDSQNGQALGALAGLSNVLGGGSGDGSLFSGDNIIWLYTSDRMLGKTLLDTVSKDGKKIILVNWLLQIDGNLQDADNKLREGDKGYHGFPDKVLNRPQLSRAQGQLLSIAISQIRSKYIQVSNENNTVGIVGVTFVSRDELFSFAFANKIVALVNDFYINTKTKKEQEQVAVLQKKVDEFNRNMGTSMRHAANAADAVPNANPMLRALQVKPQREIVDVQVNSAIYTTMVQQLEMAKVALAKETPLIQVVDAPALPLGVIHWGYVKAVCLFGIIFVILALMLLICRRVYRNVLEK